MMRHLPIILATFFLLAGCQKAPHKQDPVIRPGSDYAEAKELLQSHGLEERDEPWEMVISEEWEVKTYFLRQDVALLITVEKATGKIVQLERYEGVDRAKAFRTATVLESFDPSTVTKGSP